MGTKFTFICSKCGYRVTTSVRTKNLAPGARVKWNRTLMEQGYCGIEYESH